MINPDRAAAANAEIEKGILIAFLSVCLALIASLIWFHKWEGRKNFE